MDLKAKKESLSKQYNELTKSINKSLDMRSRVLGALELLHQIDNDKEMNICKNCKCRDCDCYIDKITQDEELKPQYDT